LEDLCHSRKVMGFSGRWAAEDGGEGICMMAEPADVVPLAVPIRSAGYVL